MPAKKKPPPAIAPQPKELTCGNCRHWHVLADDPKRGDCHFNPPEILAANEDGTMVMFRPRLRHDERACGQFSPHLND